MLLLAGGCWGLEDDGTDMHTRVSRDVRSFLSGLTEGLRMGGGRGGMLRC